jgi:hypothetical protein
MNFFVTDVVLICDEKNFVMDLNSIYANIVRHGFNSVFVIIFRVPDCLTAPLTTLVVCDDQIWS